MRTTRSRDPDGKVGIQQAYRNIPVVPEDRRLLGMKWQGN